MGRKSTLKRERNERAAAEAAAEAEARSKETPEEREQRERAEKEQQERLRQQREEMENLMVQEWSQSNVKRFQEWWKRVVDSSIGDPTEGGGGSTSAPYVLPKGHDMPHAPKNPADPMDDRRNFEDRRELINADLLWDSPTGQKPVPEDLRMELARHAYIAARNNELTHLWVVPGVAHEIWFEAPEDEDSECLLCKTKPVPGVPVYNLPGFTDGIWSLEKHFHGKPLIMGVVTFAAACSTNKFAGQNRIGMYGVRPVSEIIPRILELCEAYQSRQP